MTNMRPLRPVSQVEPRLTFRTVHGYRRAIRVAGQGPPIVLIHGIGDNSETWLDVIPHLAANYTVIAPDLLGHGRSDKPRADYSISAYANGLRDLLTVLEVERATIIGHSLGGGVAMQFAYQYPHMVDRLVIVSSAGIHREVHPVLRAASVPGLSAALQVLQLPGARRALDVVGRALAGIYDATGHTGASVGHDAVDIMRVLADQSDRMGHRAFVRTLRAGADWRGQAITILDRCYLNEQIPVQIIWGERDAVLPVAHAHLAYAAMPGSRLEIFADSAHFPFRDELLRFIGVVQRFLDSTDEALYDHERWRTALTIGMSASNELARRTMHPTALAAPPLEEKMRDVASASERSAT
ncbi:alpha/beta fold hydrolase [Antrihabitans sp. YC3-6]|uniref:Alpha/beta fold hydrolase n=1 Tax=Antrihabitans stalagmiti TaxID=2799499 RepID=A0A934U5J8_9NOCA|nr:alpha/beta fold hydrolase [Antrihabitans stalagmiti]MBJ8341432.1 alpha/beta fold hydrolase [Antrihabitans stalagmiti]